MSNLKNNPGNFPGIKFCCITVLITGCFKILGYHGNCPTDTGHPNGLILCSCYASINSLIHLFAVCFRLILKVIAELAAIMALDLI